MIAEAIDKVGKDGVITVEESQTFGMEMELVEGMRFDKGYISPYFVTDPDPGWNLGPRGPVHPDRRLEDLGGPRQCSQCSRRSMQTGKPLMILSEDVEGEALATLVVNNIRGTFRSTALRPPASESSRKAMLRGHCHPHRRSGHHRGGRPQARQRSA